MAGGVEISRDLKEWASIAGFSLTPTDRDGRAVFSSSNGETRYFIGRGADDLLRVTSSNRRGPEQLELAAPLQSTIEKYFYGFFGPDVRYDRELAQATPVERLPGGFGIASLGDVSQVYLARFDAANRDYLVRYDNTNQAYLARYDNTNQDYLALIDAQGDTTAIDGFGRVLARIRLSDLAVYMSHDAEEIKASFMADDGAPLLAVIEGEGEGTPAPA